MILDPQVAALLDMFRTQGMPDFVDLGVEGARQAVAAFLQLEGPPAEVAEVRELTAPGPDGNVLPMRSYRPALDGDLPVLLYFHGGGFVIGDLAVADAPCRELANATGAIVISVDYRMGPEHRSPAAAEDCYAATVWAERHASSLGGDGARLGVSGDSAGGNLATVVALMARDRGGPALRAQFLLCPITDLDLTTDAYPSRVENGEGYLLTARTLAWFYENYLEKPDDAADIHNSPIHADLSALPPAVVVTAGYDPLRDEGDAYAAALRAAGVEVLHLPNPSMIHGFLWMAGVVDHAHAVFDQVGAFAKKHL